ncbi:MAG: 30S ribosome-binding factor RbfA [Prevotellaceae bacterium]|nr:30S ribosome-binding factor RbfA [Prevotellaceae bacterium]MDD7108027.1 30S ribosome-binding factor RbfA [Prevotellaceae bacterium]MDY3295814.1 30S ribosome-binding factor RbfA [Bacteroidaceae bacterium]
MEKTRQNKIERLIQKELSNLFLNETRKTHGMMVSVSECRISPDLSYCTAYISVFPSEKSEETIKNLTENVKTIRYELGQRLRYQLRIVPELRFFKDDTLDYMEHIDELLKK